MKKKQNRIKMFLYFIIILLIDPLSYYPQNNNYFPKNLSLQKALYSISQNWDWQFVNAPLGDSTNEGILVDPDDDNVWYVSSISNGLYITRNGGNSWEHPLIGKGVNVEGFQIDPKNSNTIIVAKWNKVYRSNNKGVTWDSIYTCPESIRSILISKFDGSIYLAPQTQDNNNPGIYKSTDGGKTFIHLPFGVSTNNIICWDIEEDSGNGYLYIGAELADHPQPYHPPFFRSKDGGQSWQEISGDLYWHGLKTQVDPVSHKIFYLLERGGLYESDDFGDSWHLASYFYGFFLLMDKNNKGYLYGGDNPGYADGGGAYLSIDSGKTFERIGLDTLNVTSLALNKNSTKLFVTCYGSGIYKVDIPEIVIEEDSGNKNIIVTNTNDTGEGSFRNSIELANTNAGADTIIFNIPKSDVNFDNSKGIWIIKPESRMPVIYDSNLVIDGTSQRSFIGEDTNPDGPEIILNGSAGVNRGLELTNGSNGTEIYEITINSFNYSGISFNRSKRCIVSGCYIGTNYSGMKSAGMNAGIYIFNKSNNIHIGPSSYLDKPNVISGNRYYGISFNDSTQYNYIIGNYIGLNKTAADTVGNTGYGIDLNNSSNNNIIEGNFIGGNYVGISIGGSNYNNIKNNFIGTNGRWEEGFGNSTGIRMWSNASNNKIKENIIGFNWLGITVDSSNSVRNILSRNLIAKNSGLGIANRYGGNSGLAAPVITTITNNEIKGTAGANQVIEIFADSSNQGKIYIDSTISDADGNFTLTVSAFPELPNITATARDADGNTSEFSSPFIITDVKEEKIKLPTEYTLYQNYPNPFNPATTIKYSIPFVKTLHTTSQHVQLKIYDILGKEVATLVNKKQTAGNYEITFDASRLTSGIYYYKIIAGEFNQVRKMILLK